MHTSPSPKLAVSCSFSANKSVVWPPSVTVSTAQWQAMAAAALSAWVGAWQGPLVPLLTATGKQKTIL